MGMVVKKISGSVLVVIVSIFLINTATAETTAQDTVERYMKSLFSGDVATLETCLDKNLSQRRRAVLDDPAYPGFLIDRYDGATYHLLRVQIRNNGTTVVDVEIVFGSNEKMTVRFVLNHRHEIIDEISM